MTIRKIKFVEGEVYHVYNRGNFKHQIFHDIQDYERFKKIMYVSNGTKIFKFKDISKYLKNIYNFPKGNDIVNILAYVQMPNHFHLMIEVKPVLYTLDPVGGSTNKNFDNNLSVFIKRLTSSYSMYYNRKYNRTGSLFEGRFKAEHVQNDEYFKYLFSYIHLNPVKLFQPDWREIGILDIKRTNEFLENYEHSSFKDYFTTPGKAGGIIVNKQEFFNKLGSGVDLEREIFDWLNYINTK